MMGLVNTVVAREMTAERQRAAERARSSRAARSSVVGTAAMERQRARVQLSLLLVSRRRESAGNEAE